MGSYPHEFIMAHSRSSCLAVVSQWGAEASAIHEVAGLWRAPSWRMPKRSTSACIVLRFQTMDSTRILQQHAEQYPPRKRHSRLMKSTVIDHPVRFLQVRSHPSEKMCCSYLEPVWYWLYTTWVHTGHISSRSSTRTHVPVHVLGMGRSEHSIPVYPHR